MFKEEDFDKKQWVAITDLLKNADKVNDMVKSDARRAWLITGIGKIAAWTTGVIIAIAVFKNALVDVVKGTFGL